MAICLGCMVHASVFGRQNSAARVQSSKTDDAIRSIYELCGHHAGLRMRFIEVCLGRFECINFSQGEILTSSC